MKTSELIGSSLNHAVHIALGLGYRRDEKYGPMYFRPSQAPGVIAWDNSPPPYSTDWSQGGPIIERERIGVEHDAPNIGGWIATAYTVHGRVDCAGPTPLIAAMRCFCCSRLGEYVDVPKELCQRQSS